LGCHGAPANQEYRESGINGEQPAQNSRKSWDNGIGAAIEADDAARNFQGP
jgi:hypothetical protein